MYCDHIFNIIKEIGGKGYILIRLNDGIESCGTGVVEFEKLVYNWLNLCIETELNGVIENDVQQCV